MLLTIDHELERVRETVSIAECRLDMALASNPDLLDAAIYELKAAELRYSALLRERRGAV